MKFYRFFLILFVSFSTFGFAHDANKAFFTIQQKDNIVEVLAEFPWSIRNALIEAYPELENSKSQAEFDSAFFNYVNSNFKIKHNSSVLKLISVEEATHQGHSHQNNFVFIFEGTAFDTIKNTMMFNVYDNQENYHDVLVESRHLKFVTAQDSDSIIVESTAETSFENKTKIGLIVIAFLVLVFILWLKQRKS